MSCIIAISLFCKCCLKAKKEDKSDLDDAGQKTDALKNKIDPKVEQPKVDQKKTEPPKKEPKAEPNTEQLKNEPTAEQPEEELKDKSKGEQPKEELKGKSKAEQLKTEPKAEPETEQLKKEPTAEPKTEQLKKEPTAEQPEEELKGKSKGEHAQEETKVEQKTAEPTNEAVDTAPAKPAKPKIVRDIKERNILIVGRSRSGKTTLVNSIEDVCQVGEPGSIFFSTREPKLQTTDLSEYKFRVLDTPGLCEYAPKGQTTRDNQEIVRLIKEKAEEHFGGAGFEEVDTVIITFTVETGIISEDIVSLNALLPELPAHAKKILVITHAESFTLEDQKSIQDEISQHKELAALVNTYFRGKENILFSGCLDSGDVEFERTTQRKLRQVHIYKERLIQELLPAAEPADAKKDRMDKTAHKIEAFFKARFPEEIKQSKEEAKAETTAADVDQPQADQPGHPVADQPDAGKTIDPVAEQTQADQNVEPAVDQTQADPVVEVVVEQTDKEVQKSEK